MHEAIKIFAGFIWQLACSEMFIGSDDYIVE